MIRAFLKKVGLLTKKGNGKSPTIIARSDHGISRKDISENALKVLYRLNRHGYAAYLVGGGVRDLLLGLHPKDFDVVTDATPEEVRKVFRNCRLIGRRFRLAHVYFGHDIVEVATFRKVSETPSEDVAHSDHGMILRDNVYGTMSEDVWRRDFTINALYYNIADFSIVDYLGGFADLKAKRIKMIGDPAKRMREDPVRMLRAVRFACKLHCELPKELTQPMTELKALINHVSSARMFEEIMKMFHSGVAFSAYEHLLKHDLFIELFPATAECLKKSVYPTHKLLSIVFQNTDERIKQEKTVTPSFIVAALLWHPICLRAEVYLNEKMAFFPARMQAIEDVLQQQTKRVSIPKRIVQGAREIWLLQMRMMKRYPKRVHQLLEEPRFRAAYDFLECRAQAGEKVTEVAKWWKDFIEGDAKMRKDLLKAVENLPRGKKPRRRSKD